VIFVRLIRSHILTYCLQNKRLIIFYGSQTGTAEEYAIRFAKEAKAKFGLSSLVCDPEEFDFENLDTIPEDCAAVFFMASYGEGEPTDNAVQLMQNMGDDSFAFSNGEHKLEGLRYIVFGLGNKTYEHFNLVARNIDKNLSDAGATRIGERGEGDDDRSMEEDYMEWKDSIWEHLAAALNVEEGAGGDSTDFEVKEVADIASEKVYLGGSHSARTDFASTNFSLRRAFGSCAYENSWHPRCEEPLPGSGH
jgi:NADPH-ferrihemoprotein reductase